MDRKQKKRKAPIIEALEPRILFSADLFGGATDNPGADDSLATLLDDTAVVLEKQTAQLLKEQTDTALYELPAEDDDVSLAPAKDAIRTELVFVDTDTPDYQQLVDDMLSGSDDNRRLEVILLDNNRDGIEQITSALQDYQGIDAVHLISHGEDGAVDLGNTQLNNQTLATYQAELESWAEHLNADADILFYGCDLAASEDGQTLINRIATFTGADIAASDDLTGNAELGGDWELEYNAGQIEAQIALSEQVQVTWQGSLSQSLWLSTDSNVTSSGANGLDSWTEGQVLEFSGASLAHGDTTAGDLSMVIDFDTFTSNPVDAGGLHFVSHDMTVGGANGTFDLKAGDVLVSFLQDETILAAHSSTGADMLVQDQDLLVFRPDAFNDYSAGTFTVLLDDVVADDLKGVTLIEQDTTIGGTDVAAGSFLLIAETSGTTSIDLFVPTGVGEATTTGTTTPLIDISDLGIDPDTLRGIEVVEAATTIGGQSLAKGDILATLRVDDTGVGSNNLPVDQNDVFVLRLTSTGMGTTAGTATMFLDGSDVGLDDNPSAESPYALALHNYSQLTVDTTSDVADGDTSSIEALLLDKGADGKISLREAIEAANATPNGDSADTIRFNITDALVDGAHTISVGSALPSITDTLVMDGTSEPDFSGTPVIRIDGSGAGSNADGLYFTSTSDNSTVRGFMITGFDRDGIYVDSGADYLTFTGNWIGTTGAGSTGVGNGDDGIDLRGSNATIGGTGANEGNVITNSGDEGFQIYGTGVTAHLVQGNVIGLDPDGESGSGNSDVGLAILSGSGNIFGGTTASARNVISNNFEGIEVNSSNNVFQGNYIGSDASGTLDRGNRSDDGIEIQSGATGNLIGGTETGAGNLIAFNARDGVNIVDGSGNTVLGNQIHSNSDLGIDLDTGGVTSNDSNDGDTGANNLQNYPTITTADLNGSNLTLSGTLDTDGVSTSYRIEFFGNAAGTQDATNGEGRFFLGSTTVTTDVNGDASFNDVLLSGITLSDGDYVSATATRIDDAGQVGSDDQLAYGDTSEFAVNIAITAVNDAPELSGANDLNPINEDEVGNAGTLVSDIIAGQISDADSNSVEGIAVTAVDDTNGTWQYTIDGGTNWFAFGAVDSSNARLLAADTDTSVRFVPDANWNGTVTNGITLHAWDQISGTAGGTADLSTSVGGSTAFSANTASSSVTVNAVTDLSATDDSFSVDEDTTLNDTVASNDSTTSGGALSYAVNTDVSNGSLTLNNDGSFSYTPAANYHGSDNFTYTVTDADSGESSTQTVSLTVNQINDTAVFSGDTTGSGDEDTVISGALIASDSADGMTSPNYTVSTDGANGTANIDAAGNWSYTPAANYSGSDSFTVSVTDDDGNVETQVISITVNAVTDLTAQDDSFTLDEDTTLSDTVATNDSTTSGGALSYALASDVTNGSLTLNTNGSFSYTPAANYHGSDSFTYTVTDADSGESSTQTVSLTVNQVDDAGTFGGDVSATTNEDAATSGTVTFADATDGYTANNFALTSGAGNGTAAVDSNGNWSYTPSANYSGADSFVVQATDDDGNVETQVISITVNAATDLTAQDDSFSVDEDTTLNDTVATNDSTTSGGALSYAVNTDVTNGSLTLNNDGSFSYTPTANYHGSDSFTYTVTDDDSGESATQTVSLTVNQVDDAGTFGGDVSATTNEDAATSGTVTFADATDGYTANNFALTSGAGNGTAAVDSNGNWSYTPSANYSGADSFVVQATDDDGNVETQVISITVNAVTDLTATDDSFTLDEDTTLNDTVAGNDSTTSGGALSYAVNTDVSNGSLTLNTNGSFSYTPAANYHGSDSFTYTVTDADSGESSTQTASLTVNQINDTAVFSGDTTGSGDEDTVISGALTASDSADGMTSPNYTVTTDGANGTASIDAAGNWSYTPAANYSGSDSFTVSVTDDDGNVESQVINLTVNAVTDLTAQDDSFTLDEDTTISDTVASNDSTTSGGSLSYAVNTDVSNGSLTLNTNGSFSYTPAANYHGSDSFTYTVTDADSGESATQTVSLTVNQINDTAVFSGDTTGSGDEDTVISGALTASDSADGMTSPNYTVSTDGANGTANIDAAGNWSYTPAANYSGSDSFTVSVTDDDGNVESQVITLTVNAVTDLTAQDDSFSVDEDTTLNDTVATNDSTTSGGALSYAVNTDVTNGSLTLNNDGSFSYTPTANYHGSDSFTYTVTDADSGESATQTVSLTVNQVDDAGTFGGDVSATTNEDTATSGTVTFADATDGYTANNFALTSGAGNGTAAVDSNGNWSYTPSANYSGADSFVVQATDDDGNVETQVISITVNAATDLTATDDSFTLNEDTTLNDTVASNDSTTSGGSLSYAVNTDVSNGSLTLNNDGSFSYTPTANYHGSDSFTYTVTDADSGESATQTVSLTVNQVDDAGTFGGDVSATTNEDTATSGTVTFADATDGYTANNFALTSGAGNGTAAVDSNGNWSYTPSANYSGADSFVVQATDDDGNVETQVISITVNAATDLTATDDSFTLNEDTTLNDTVASNDSTTSGGSLSYAVNTDVSNGSLTLNTNGSFSYTPAANYHGSDSFTYTVTDADSGESATQTVSLTVNQINDTAVFSGDTTGSGDEDTVISGALTASDSADGMTSPNYTVSTDGANGTANIDAAGNWSYTPAANYSGSDSFTVSVTDDDGNVESQVITLTVNPVGDLTATDDSFTLNEDTTLNDTVAGNDSTTSGGALSYALASDVSNGSLTLNNDGSFSYTPTANYNGSDGFTYTVTDADSGESSTQTVSLTVNQINDTAVFSGDTTGSGDEDTVISGTLTASDSADGMTSPNYTVTTDGANGTANIDAAGNWSYTPAANYSGSDSFTVSVTDDDGNVESQVITLTVNPVGDLTATDDSFTLNEDTTLNDTVAGNDSTTSGGALSYALASDVSNGSLTLNNDGSFSYTPTANYNGSDGFTYTVTDADSGESSTQTVSLTVNQINDTAVFSGDTTGSGDEDTVISGTLTASDSADGMTSPNYTVTTDGANGTANIDAAGNWSYTPAANYSGSDSFTVSVTDDDGNVETQVISITVNAMTDLTATDDSFTLNEDTTLNDTVASNDSTTSGGSLSYAVNTDVSNGSLTLNNDGSFSYTPTANYHGSDGFTYTVTDADSGESATQTVSLTVNQVDDAGTFGGDVSATTNEDTATSGTVTFADATDGYTANNFALTSGAGNGTAAVDSNGNWSYTPSANYSGADSFVVQATDDDGNVETQVISITVNAVTDLTATDDSFTLNEDTTLNDTVASNDSTTSGGSLSYAVNTDVSNGSLTLNNDGSFSYTPTANYHGSDSFTYTVTDADSGESATQTVSLTVNQINDTAVFSGDTTGSGDEDTVISGTLIASDSADGMTSPNYTVSTDGVNGTANIDAAGNWSYTPAANYSGSDSFTVSVTDDDGNVESQVITLTVNPVGDLTATDDSFTLNEDTTLNDTVAGNDSTTSGGALSYALASDVSNGSLTLNNDGSFSYTPTANYHGSDSFTYTVTDADSGESATQTVSLTVNQINDTAVFSGDTTGSGDEDTVISGTLIASDSADGMTSPNYTVTTDGANGTANIDAAGNWSYTPAANYSGSDSFTVSVTDDDGNVESQVINLTVNAVTDLTAQDDSFTLDEDTTLNDTVASNDSTTSGGSLSYAVNTDVSNGSLTLNNDGSFSYTPAANYHGSDSFTYTVTDADSGESATQTVSLTVNQINDTAVFSGDTTGSGDEDTVISGTLIASDSADGMTSPNYTVTTDGANGTASIDAAGNWSYTPAANWSGTDQFTVTVVDDEGGTHEQVVSITLVNKNDLPTGSVIISTTTGVVADGPLTPPSPQPEFEPVLKPTPAPEAGPESEPESESGLDLEPETEPAVAAVTVGDERLAPIDDELLVQVLATESAVPERYQYENDSHYAIPPKSIDLLNLGLAPFEPEKNEVGDLAWLMDNASFAEGIGEMKRDLDDSVTATANQEKLKTEVLLGATAGLSVGVISWVLRTGSLIAGFMSIAPLWRQVDPIPILGEDAQEHQEKDALDEQEGSGSEVEQIFDEDSSR